METINELIRKYDATAYENMRQNLKNLPLLDCYETEDGAFFRFIQNEKPFCAIIAFSAEGAENLLNHLEKEDKMVLLDLPKDVFLPMRALDKINIEGAEVLDCNAYFYLKDDIEIEEDEHIQKLSKDDALFVYENYDGKDTTSLEEIIDYIEKRPAYGYFENGKLVGWVLIHWDGQIGVLQVLEEHRSKGIAKNLMKVITKAVLDSGRVPGCEVKRDNAASIRTVTGIGYTHLGQEFWVLG